MITEKSITPTEVGIIFFIKYKIGFAIWKTISKAGFVFICLDCVNQLDIAKIIKIIVITFKILKIELLNENIIIFSRIISEPNNVLWVYTFKKWNININIKLESSNFPKFGIKVNIDLIGREILIIDWVIGLLTFALNIDKRILNVNINIKNDRIKSTMKKPSSGNEFDII